jgi:hypothetical protein
VPVKVSCVGKASLLVLLLAAGGGTGQAAELFAGVYAHDVDTALTKGGFEGGVDLQLGWRGRSIGALRAIGSPSPNAFLSVNSRGDTNYASAGIDWKIGDPLYIRPGVGLALHDRDSLIVRDGRRADLGSRLLFSPQIGIGYQVSDRVSVEASWVHLSHAQLFSRQNPGMDSIGVRMNYKFR